MSWLYNETMHFYKDNQSEFTKSSARFLSNYQLLVKFLDANRFYVERPPPERRPPFDDYYRDRPPYPEDHPLHDPAAYPPHPDEGRHSSEVPRLDKKPETVPVESILDSPGRESRPDRVSIYLQLQDIVTVLHAVMLRLVKVLLTPA